MKKIFIHTLAAATLGLTGMGPHIEAFDIPIENVDNITLPQTFAFRKLYKSDNTVIFKTDEIIFAQGKFSKKFMLKTPYGKKISVARIYELTPSNSPLLVIRDSNGFVLGFVQIEHYHRSDMFKKMTSTVYDTNGTRILKLQFPLASDHFNVYAVDHDQTKLLASTKNGKDDDTLVTFNASYQDLGIDPLLMLSLFQIHACKSLLADLGKYIAIDDIDLDDLAAYALETEGEKQIKHMHADAQLDDENTGRWQALKEALTARSSPSLLTAAEKEEIAGALAQHIERQKQAPHNGNHHANPHKDAQHEGSHNGSSGGEGSHNGSSGGEGSQDASTSDEDALLADLEQLIDTLTGQEKAVLAEMIGNRLSL